MDRDEVLERLGPILGLILGLRARTIEHGPRTRVGVSTDGVELRHNRTTYQMGEGGVKSLLSFTGLPLTLASGATARRRVQRAAIAVSSNGRGT